jgi:hypothetical protein
MPGGRDLIEFIEHPARLFYFMNNIVHIFFNGSEVNFPPNNDWEKFTGLDAARTFLICADSWRRNGWEVKRFSTAPEPGRGESYYDFPPTPFHPFTGRVKDQYHWYPADYWQFIAKAKAILNPEEWGMFVTMDVINLNFQPPHLEFIYSGDLAKGCVSFQNEHFSMSSIYCSREWLVEAERILIQYDRGELPEIPKATYISDERILREYSIHAQFKTQEFACGNNSAPLIHYARSTLANNYRDIPLS